MSRAINQSLPTHLILFVCGPIWASLVAEHQGCNQESKGHGRAPYWSASEQTLLGEIRS